MIHLENNLNMNFLSISFYKFTQRLYNINGFSINLIYVSRKYSKSERTVWMD
ncbi:MAG: hypothetical protein ACI9SJ_001826 [Flavobacteriaceae bacterium]|jgi:hypothetical protein